jgi:hypothetical protein
MTGSITYECQVNFGQGGVLKGTLARRWKKLKGRAEDIKRKVRKKVSGTYGKYLGEVEEAKWKLWEG